MRTEVYSTDIRAVLNAYKQMMPVLGTFYEGLEKSRGTWELEGKNLHSAHSEIPVEQRQSMIDQKLSKYEQFESAAKKTADLLDLIRNTESRCNIPAIESHAWTHLKRAGYDVGPAEKTASLLQEITKQLSVLANKVDNLKSQMNQRLPVAAKHLNYVISLLRTGSVAISIRNLAYNAYLDDALTRQREQRSADEIDETRSETSSEEECFEGGENAAALSPGSEVLKLRQLHEELTRLIEESVSSSEGSTPPLSPSDQLTCSQLLSASSSVVDYVTKAQVHQQHFVETSEETTTSPKIPTDLPATSYLDKIPETEELDTQPLPRSSASLEERWPTLVESPTKSNMGESPSSTDLKLRKKKGK